MVACDAWLASGAAAMAARSQLSMTAWAREKGNAGVAANVAGPHQ
jgi:hypothetical protein